MGSFALKTISIAVVIALIVGAGAGYMVGNSPVSSLMEERDWLEAEYDSLSLAFQDLEAELNSTQEILDEGQRNWELFRERYLELLEVDQENRVLEKQVSVLESLTSDVQSELDELEQVIDENMHIISGYETDVLSLQMEVERHQASLEALLAEAPFSAGDDSSASYRGYLDSWYHYMNMSTDEITPQYDAMLINGSWCLVDLGNGVCRLRMTWTELNINEEVEGAPSGTYDNFIVVIDSQEFYVHGDKVMLYGDAHWLKIHWDGTVGGWTSVGVVVDIWPNYAYGPQFYYQHERYRAGVGLLIYGSVHHSPS